MNSYTKISLAIATEVVILSIISIIIKVFINPEFDVLYILIAQISLMIIQVVCLIFQKIEFKQHLKELFKDFKIEAE